jgi:multimeric flavodoxin WrbA
MKVLAIYASPNLDGLTAACSAAAVAGARAGGAEAEEVRLNDLAIAACEVCGNGWGTCLSRHECQVADGFLELHARTCAADGVILVTPVYWGEMSEPAKAFTDRLRRCEATQGEGSCLAGKPVLAVAAAGGSGGGMITCLASMERWIQHVRARTWDLIPVNRWSRPYKLEAVRAAAKTMVQAWIETSASVDLSTESR